MHDLGAQAGMCSKLEEFLENQLRSRPVATLLAAVAAGWVVGKIVR